MRKTLRKIRRVELDSHTARLISAQGNISLKMEELKNVHVHSIYLSLFPVTGILATEKKEGLQYFKDYEIVIKTKKLETGTFIGMVKLSTYNNVQKILLKRKIKTKHVYFSPFSLARFSQFKNGNEVVVYKADTALHVMVLKDTFPVFTTTYFNITQLDEFLKEYFDDGDVYFTLLANSEWDYIPPIQFKEQKKIIEDGVIINASA